MPQTDDTTPATVSDPFETILEALMTARATADLPQQRTVAKAAINALLKIGADMLTLEKKIRSQAEEIDSWDSSGADDEIGGQVTGLEEAADMVAAWIREQRPLTEVPS